MLVGTGCETFSLSYIIFIQGIINLERIPKEAVLDTTRQETGPLEDVTSKKWKSQWCGHIQRSKNISAAILRVFTWGKTRSSRQRKLITSLKRQEGIYQKLSYQLAIGTCWRSRLCAHRRKDSTTTSGHGTESVDGIDNEYLTSSLWNTPFKLFFKLERKKKKER